MSLCCNVENTNKEYKQRIKVERKKINSYEIVQSFTKKYIVHVVKIFLVGFSNIKIFI